MPTTQRPHAETLLPRLLLLGALALLPLGLRAETIALDGVVADEAGRPLAGATVELKPILAKFEVARLLLSGKDDLAAAATARTDASGRYSLQAPAPGMWVLLASAPGRTVLQRSLIPLLEPISLGEARLAPAVEVRLRVVDPDGRPIAGAIVQAAPASRRADLSEAGRYGWRAAGIRILSDAGGKIAFRREKTQSLSLGITARGFLPLDAEEDELSSPDLRLKAGCPRRFLALDPARKPVPGVIVAGSGAPVGQSGADGALTVAVPCGRKSALRWWTPDGRQGLEPFDSPPAAAAAGAPEPPAVLPIPARPAFLAGKVVERTSRRPIAGAWVWPSYDAGAAVRSDASGSYLIALPDPRDLSLQAVSDRAAEKGEPWNVPKGVQREGRFAGPTFSLRPTAAIEGTVVDEGGAPIAGARLEVSSDSATSLVQIWSAGAQPTAANGAFRMRVEAGIPFTVSAYHPRRPTAHSEQTPLKAGERRGGLRLLLLPGRAAFGRVVDAAESPVAGAQVSLAHSEGSDTDAFWGTTYGDAGDDAMSATTGADGRFTFDKIPETPLDLEVRATGFAPLTVPGIDLPPPPVQPNAPPAAAPAPAQAAAKPADPALRKPTAKPADLGTVVLHAGLRLRGLVVDKAGKPIAGALVRPMPEGYGSRFRWAQGANQDDGDEIYTGLDGRFEVGDLDGGHQVSLLVYKKGYQAAQIGNLVVPADEPVKVVLLNTFTLQGSVSDEDGHPLPSAVVFQVVSDSSWSRPGARPRNRPLRQGKTDAEGRFEIEVSDPGKLRVEATAPGFLGGGVDVEVPEPRDVDGIEIVLHPGAVLLGRILGTDGQPLDEATVSVGGDESFIAGMADPTAQTGEGGEYRLEGLATGTIAASFQRRGYSRLQKEVEIRPGENRLDVRLEKALAIEGRVLDPEGRPLAKARVTAEGGEGGSVTSSKADGSFSIDGAEPGTYSVYADHTNFGPSERASITLAGGPATGIELQVTAGGTLRGRVLGLKFEQLQDVSVVGTLQEGTQRQISYKEGRVDYQGEYKLAGLEPGEWRVGAHYGSRFASGTVTLPAGGEATLDLEFKDGYPLAGHVTRHGEPVEHASVMALDRQGKANGYGQTDSRGAFRIDGLKAGSYLLQIVGRNAGLRRQQEIEIPLDGELAIDLPSSRLNGRVVDQAGRNPLAGVVVSLHSEVAENDPFGRFMPPTSGESSSDGSFLLESVSPGHYRLTGAKDGYTRGELEVDVVEDRDASLELQLRRADRQAVRIVGAPGVGPVRQAEVALIDVASGQVLSQNSVRLDESGGGEIDALPGTWELAVTSGNSATALQTLTIPGPAPTLTLFPPTFLAVRVPALQELQAGPFLELRDGAGRTFRTFSYTGLLDSRFPLYQGTAIVPNLPAGSWTLTVTEPGGKTFQGQAVTSVDKPIEVELEEGPAPPKGR